MLSVFCQSPTPSLGQMLIIPSVYQTFDGVDGKQAFKNQNCELEEFYDHICDAVANLLVTITLAISPTTQPAILYPTRMIPVETGIASAPRSDLFMGYAPLCGSVGDVMSPIRLRNEENISPIRTGY